MMRLTMLLLALLATTGVAAAAPAAPEHISHGRFRDVALYRPVGTVRQFVLLLSGKAGFDRALDHAARALAGEGAMVAGIDTAQLRAALAKDTGRCVSVDGDLENLSRYLQGFARVPGYLPPMVVGAGDGGALAYAVVAMSAAEVFPAAISLDFCPQLDLGKRACAVGGLRLRPPANGTAQALIAGRVQAPWVVLQGGAPPACPTGVVSDFVGRVAGGALARAPVLPAGTPVLPARLPQLLAAYRSFASIARPAAPAPPRSVADLPLVEVPATGTGDSFAILLSGDGGWAGLDKDVAQVMAKHGIPVVGFDSLRYFWEKRTPDELAADLDRVIRSYSARWQRPRVRLIGYSQGADVLPFAINRLSPETRRMVVQNVLIGLGTNASFEFHLTHWMGNEDADGLPILPEVSRLRGDQTLCLYGEGETESLCPKIPPGHVTARTLPGGHHFDGAYDRLADIILGPAAPR